MYIEPTTGYYIGAEQHTRRGLFLILLQDKALPIGPDNLRAVVRKVALRQFGPWMMGRARVGPAWITLSGSYGGDGLPVSVSSEAYLLGLPVPRELYDAWNHGEGWNSCGREAPLMRRWAREHLKELRGKV